MNVLSLIKIRRPILFETALQDADLAALRSLKYDVTSLEPRRRKLLEAELARREAAESVSWLPSVLMFTACSGIVLCL